MQGEVGAPERGCVAYMHARRCTAGYKHGALRELEAWQSRERQVMNSCGQTAARSERCASAALSDSGRVPDRVASSVVNTEARAALPQVIRSAIERPGRCLLLTGAGISAESGVPTFRGKDGYWVVGSRNYHAQELATRSAFLRMPESVWGWYLHRSSVCRGAQPNRAHEAVVQIERTLADRFLLITQNVDGLHLRAGNSVDRTYEIHGNLAFMRCSRDCSGLVPVPDAALQAAAGQLRGLLSCTVCGAWMRPHVLWFDEYYDEPLFRFESSLAAVDQAALLIVIGTTGGTNLPLAIGERAARRQVPMIVINNEPNPFCELCAGRADSIFLAGRASEWMPHVARHLQGAP